MNPTTKHIVELKGHKTVWLVALDVPNQQLFVRYRNLHQATYLQVPQLCFDDLVASLRAGEQRVWVFPGLSESHYLNFPVEWWTQARKRDYFIDRDGYVQLDLKSARGRQLSALFKSSCRAVTLPITQMPDLKS